MAENLHQAMERLRSNQINCNNNQDIGALNHIAQHNINGMGQYAMIALAKCGIRGGNTTKYLKNKKHKKSRKGRKNKKSKKSRKSRTTKRNKK